MYLCCHICQLTTTPLQWMFVRCTTLYGRKCQFVPSTLDSQSQSLFRGSIHVVLPLFCTARVLILLLIHILLRLLHMSLSTAELNHLIPSGSSLNQESYVGGKMTKTTCWIYFTKFFRLVFTKEVEILTQLCLLISNEIQLVNSVTSSAGHHLFMFSVK